MKSTDYYKILQVDPSADREVIEAAHRQLALKYYPDRNKSPDATDRISAVQLKFALEENGIHAGQIYDAVNSRINSWVYGRIIRPNDDLTLGEVQPRTFGHGKAEILHIGGGTIGRLTLEPGWR